MFQYVATSLGKGNKILSQRRGTYPPNQLSELLTPVFGTHVFKQSIGITYKNNNKRKVAILV